MFPYKFQVQMVSHVHSIDLFGSRAMTSGAKPMVRHACIEIRSRRRSFCAAECDRSRPDWASNYVEAWDNRCGQRDLCYVSHRKQTRVKHHGSLHWGEYWNCRLKRDRWTTRANNINSMCKYRNNMHRERTTTCVSWIRLTYRSVLTEDLDAPLDVNLKYGGQEESFYGFEKLTF